MLMRAENSITLSYLPVNEYIEAEYLQCTDYNMEQEFKL